ncbi:MAG TPA: ATP-binding protein [Polyangiales bacterium]
MPTSSLPPRLSPRLPPPSAPNSLLPPAQALTDDERTTTRRLQLFMGTRLAVATLLLGGTLLLALENQHGMDSFTPKFLVSLIATIYGGSLVFSVWLLSTERRDRVALAQVAGDLLLTTGLVYVTGGPGSGFTFLYGVAVLMAAMVVGPLPARITGAIAVALYVALVTSISMRWLPAPPDQSVEAYRLPVMELVYATLLNVLGLFLVTLLAGNLSARLLSAGGRLRIAEASAATLAQLNDDIVRSLNSGLLTTDLAGRIRTVNPAGADIFRTDPFALIDEPISNCLPIDVSAITRSRTKLDGPVMRAEGQATRPDGSRFPVGFSLNSLINLDGALIGTLVLFQDLSEIVQLRETAARSERLGVLGRLSAGLAHEIRNPLSSISGSVELVRDSTHLDTEDRRLLGIVLHEVERLDDLVSTMLLVGRPREPRRSEIDLRALVTEVVEMARRGPSVDASVGIDYRPSELPVVAFADGDQIRQVLWNLVKNALQASPPGTTVSVSARQLDTETSVLEVSDQGRGIDPGQREKVYNMFYSERTHGAGIGLALVRQIVDAHAGAIEIRSEESRGASFMITLPTRAGAAGRPAPSSPPASA